MMNPSQIVFILSKTSAVTVKLLITQRPGNMKQYEEDSMIPKMTANIPAPKDKNIDRRIRELEDKIRDQAQEMHRMHRDIVRLRTAINEVSARIK
jgi:septal ring factor EnvC (AmiA/AmiB activator)